MKLSLKHYQATNDVFTRLNNLRRWTDFTTQQKYNELAKQAFNCFIAYLIAKCCEHEGWKINYESFPHIAMGRAFAKAYVYYDTPEHKITEICDLSKISKEEFDKVAKRILKNETDANFADFIDEDGTSNEVKIYKAATKIATYIEFVEQDDYLSQPEKFYQIRKDLDAYMDLPGVKEFAGGDSKMHKLLCEISTLRNQVRWATCSYTTECSVLGHLFDTAVFAYLNAIDKGLGEQVATKLFFMGIYHDIAETWTKDIPSPIKDKIEGFRTATEAYELKMVEEHIYARIPDFLAKAVKEVMMEDEENKDFKTRLKAADYLSADSECYRNYMSGSRDPYFDKAVLGNKVMCTSKAGIALHEYFIDYVKKLNL